MFTCWFFLVILFVIVNGYLIGCPAFLPVIKKNLFINLFLTKKLLPYICLKSCTCPLLASILESIFCLGYHFRLLSFSGQLYLIDKLGRLFYNITHLWISIRSLSLIAVPLFLFLNQGHVCKKAVPSLWSPANNRLSACSLQGKSDALPLHSGF